VQEPTSLVLAQGYDTLLGKWFAKVLISVEAGTQHCQAFLRRGPDRVLTSRLAPWIPGLGLTGYIDSTLANGHRAMSSSFTLAMRADIITLYWDCGIG